MNRAELIESARSIMLCNDDSCELPYRHESHVGFETISVAVAVDAMRDKADDILRWAMLRVQRRTAARQ